MNIATLGIDIGKTWFHLVGGNDVGTAVMRQKLNRNKLMVFLAPLPKCLVGCAKVCKTLFEGAKE